MEICMNTAHVRPATRRAGPLGPTRRGNFVVGCLAIVGLLVLIIVIAGVIFGPRIPELLRGAGGEGFRAAGHAIITETDLPAGEKPDMKGHIDRVADGMKDGSVSFEQMGRLLETLVEDEVLIVGIVYAIDEGYLKPSGLSEEEKAEGSTQLMRFAQGIHEGSISKDQLNNAAAPVGSNDDDGNFRLNDKAGVTDDQLRQVIANASRIADSAGVPAEPVVVDLSDEFGKMIDESLGFSPGEPATSDAPPADPAGDPAGDPPVDDEGP
jgi:hypothetical protein